MALNTPQTTSTEKITVRAIGEELPHDDYQRCPQCDILFSLPEVNSYQSAYYPRCQAKARDERDWSLTHLTAIAFTMLLLVPSAWDELLLHIWLLSIHIDANVVQGIWQVIRQGDTITGAVVFFCVIDAPLILVSFIAYLWFGNRLGMNLYPVLLVPERLREWVMLDIYLVGTGVVSIKVQDYAHTQAGVDLLFFAALVVSTTVALSHLSAEELRERYYPQRPAARRDEKLRICLGCYFTSYPDQRGRYPRCHIPLHLCRRHSLQKCWAAPLTSIVLLLPVNLSPISTIYLNGERQEDTVLSGIMSLASSNITVAGIVFIVGILVPFTKVTVMFTLLLNIYFKCQQGLRTRILLLRMMTWVGRWSMLDLFVISLTMPLISRSQIPAFTTGPTAFYFGAAVVLAVPAVEWPDNRLLWDAHESENARFDDRGADQEQTPYLTFLVTAFHRTNNRRLTDLGQLPGPG